nr:WAT1-related protein At1g68170-like [Ipomoea batatas]
MAACSVVAMVVVQMLLGGDIVLCKVAADEGMPVSIIVAYRFIFSAAFLSPIAFMLERETPRLKWTIVLQSFLTVLMGGTLFNNIAKTSATFADASGSIVPAMTTVISVLLTAVISVLRRKEKISLRTVSGKARVISIIICIGGAMLLTFYKGVELPTHNHFSLVTQPAAQSPVGSHSGNYALGVILAILACLCYSISIVLLSVVRKNYTCHYLSTSLMNLMGAVQSTLYALCTERDNWSGWKLDLKLFLIMCYSGFLASGVAVILCIWCDNKSGPLFVSIFNPLALVFVALGSSLLLNEPLYLGSVLGGIVIIAGIYGVLWAKERDMKQVSGAICDIEMAGE